MVARVFEPFFTTKDIGKGSGLGLAQVYGFARQSGGTVRIETALGRGTSISLLLPRSRRVPLPEAVPAADIAERPAADSLGHVLMVEDDDEVAALVAEMLGQIGFTVTRASSAVAALGALADDRPVELVDQAVDCSVHVLVLAFREDVLATDVDGCLDLLLQLVDRQVFAVAQLVSSLERALVRPPEAGQRRRIDGAAGRCEGRQLVERRQACRHSEGGSVEKVASRNVRH